MTIENAKLVNLLSEILEDFRNPVTIIKDNDGISVFSTYSDYDGKNFVGSIRAAYTLVDAADALKTEVERLMKEKDNLESEVKKLFNMREKIRKQLEVGLTLTSEN
jgi:hypothetical protein